MFFTFCQVHRQHAAYNIEIMSHSSNQWSGVFSVCMQQEAISNKRSCSHNTLPKLLKSRPIVTLGPLYKRFLQSPTWKRILETAYSCTSKVWPPQAWCERRRWGKHWCLGCVRIHVLFQCRNLHEWHHDGVPSLQWGTLPTVLYVNRSWQWELMRHCHLSCSCVAKLAPTINHYHGSHID